MTSSHSLRPTALFLALGLGLLTACGGAGDPPPPSTALHAPSPGAGPQPLSTPIWYVIADSGGASGGNDWLFSVDITLSPPLNGQTAIGTGTGTDTIEGSAFWPGSDTLYAFDPDRLGTIDLTTGEWAEVVNKDVWDDGNGGNGTGLDANRNAETLKLSDFLNDVDSVSFDPNTGKSYGVSRATGPDILFEFSTTTGRIVRGAFTVGGTAYDFIRVPPVEAGNEDIDDIAIDPYDGQLYGIANGGGLADRLVRIDKFTGLSSDVGRLGVDDMEGFAFYNDASMWGVTGGSSNLAPDGTSNDNSIFSINRITGEAYDRRPLTVGGGDFESMAFLTADLNEFCGRVWRDTNGNGIQDVGEPGEPNVTVILWRDVENNDVLDAGTDIHLVSTTTDASGDYCFAVASTGDYVITTKPDTLPPDFVLSHPNVREVSVVGFGNTVNGLDFIMVGTLGTLGDTVFLDIDGDGLLDVEDPGLRDVTVRLVDPGPDATCGTADDTVLQSTTTDGGGYFSFRGLLDAAYCLDVDETTLPPSSTLTTGNEPYATSVVAGSNDLAGDFGYQFPGRIGDLVWLDVDADGIADPLEPGLAGVDVTLKSRGADGFLDTADDVTVAMVITGADGSYVFPGLAPDTYSVTVDTADVPLGTTLTTFANPLHVTIRQGEDYRDADFGFVGDASIGDRVWNDVDGDGLQDAGEAGLVGVTVNVTGAGADGTHGTADDLAFPPQTTDGLGLYTFPGLVTGLYRVDVDDSTLPAAMRTSTTGNDPLDVTLSVGENFALADFGYKTNDASIGDRLWDDQDGDGVDDVGEPGLVGVTVELFGAGPDATLGTADDVSVGTQATGVGGAYDFTALPAGSYRVDVHEATLPAGFVLTTGNEPFDLVLAGSEDFNDADIGYWRTASIGDRIWNDVDGDGVDDAGEPGMGGVGVTLTEAGPDGTHGTADDVSVATDVSAGDGSYGFTGLAPGNYRIDVDDGSLPAGFVISTGNDPLDRVLAAGQVISDADFGAWGPSSIGDFVWDDIDGDTLQGGAEPGLLGVTVVLTEAGPDATHGTADDVAVATTATNAAGAYGFPNLAPGLYRVDVDQGSVPAGYSLTTGNDPFDVALGAGMDVTNADFGFWLAASVGDRVWNDLDGDGTQDAGEPGLSGVSVDLTEAGPDGIFGTADDVVFPPVVTGVDGSYGFGGLPPGTYRVDVDGTSLPPAMALTSGNDPFVVVLGPGDVVDTVDVGFRHTGRIGDRLWDDLDGDGLQDVGEPGLVGITVQLADDGPDGICGTADDTPLPPTVTGADGAYVFDGLAASTYCLLVDGTSVPPGYVPTNGTGAQTVVLTPGQDFTDADFGYRQTGAIGDRVWQDIDEDGVQDAGEPGIVGVNVRLVAAGPDGLLGTADDVDLGTQTTVADGAYAFTGLPAGPYRVTVDTLTLPAGMQLTSANQPLDLTLTAGMGVATADFGYQFDGSIGDRVWQDLDEDGVQDLGEPGIALVGLDLTEAGVDGIHGTADDVSVGTTATAGDGTYGFGGLPPGNYRVLVNPVTVPAGMQITTGNQPLDLTLAPSQAVTTADVGYQYAGSIGDLVFEDTDADGVRDPGEPGLGGVQVVLRGPGPDATLGTADDVTVDTATTAADGSYSLTQVPPGLYRVTVDGASVPAGMALSAGTDPLDLALVGAQAYTDADFGFRHTGTLGDFVWHDLDADGAQDVGETGLGAVTVNLIEAGPDGLLGTADDVSLGSDTTAPDGSYGFNNLPAGTYRVTVATGTLPVGMLLTTGNQPFDAALAAGQTEADADFGFQYSASIGDRVWSDTDSDGVQDAGEPGLGGVTVDLVEAGPDGTLGTADDVSVGSTTTAADGSYAFTLLPPGTYRVTVPGAGLPPGALPTSGNLPFDVALGTGTTVDTADFGFQAPASIGDFVWHDLDADGVQDVGEPGLAGVSLTLVEAGPDATFGTADDVAVGTQATAPGGSYAFTGLAMGNYRVTVDTGTLPAGMLLTTANQPLDLPLAAGQAQMGADFGFQYSASIGDRVWSDPNGDGVQDVGEPGLGGVTVDLVEAGPDGTLGTADDVSVGSTTTAADGSYAFTMLPPGTYRVTVPGTGLPPGALLSSGNLPFDAGLGTGTTVDTADFGFQAPASIGDFVWHDLDADGVQDVGEPGLAGVSLTLVEAGPDATFGTADDVAVGTQATAVGGGYAFVGLAVGSYRVTVDTGSLPAGMQLTTGNQPFDTPLTGGQVEADADFGFQYSASIGDRVWSDSDGDGVQDAGEPGLGGVALDLVEAGPDGTLGTADDVSVGSTITAADGSYAFTMLPPGSYRVTVPGTGLPPGALLSSGNLPFDAVLGTATTVDTADFGFQAPASIGDFVWHDLDADGVQDVGEPGLAGVSLTLVEAGPDATFGTADDVAVGTQATAVGGGYAFVGLAVGSYRVTVDTGSLPAGMQLTTGNQPFDTPLTGGQVEADADFGFQYSASIGDRVWSDSDSDGVQDAGEPGLGGVALDLVEAGPDGTLGTADDVSVGSTTTAADGSYAFTMLPPGSYRVTVPGTGLPPAAVLTSGNLPLDVVLGTGTTVDTADFGFQAPASIGDFVWHDLDADGVQDVGEPGLAGVSLTLVEAGPDATFGTADDVAVGTQATAVGGGYAFVGLAVGSYRVTVDTGSLPAGMQLTTGNQPFDTPLTGGQVEADADFGFQYSASIGDRVWSDSDSDGVQDAGEPGLGGVALDLVEAGPDGTLGTADDVSVGSTTTAADGSYAFTLLPPGSYRVTVPGTGLPPAAVLTSGNLPLDVVLGTGTTVDTADFGFQAPSSIGDRVWDDVDGDGVQDAGEPGLNGVTVNLFSTGPDGILGTADDVLVATQTTAGNGNYGFTGLTAGLYRVDVDNATLPAGLAASGGSDPRDVNLAGGQILDDVDFGFSAAIYEVGDVIWVDSDSDGAYEPVMGERPVPGVTVTLFDAVGTVIGTATTNADGEYRFNVPPGQYTVEVDASNFATGGPLAGYTSTGAGTDVTAVITGDNFDLDFGFIGLTPGTLRYCSWWTTNTVQWPLTTIWVGGATMTATEAVALLNQGNILEASLYGRSAARAAAQADMSVLVAWALIGAKLNVGAGNPSATIEPTLIAADAWLAAVGTSSGVRAGHAQYQAGRALYLTLNAWNAGN